MTIQRISGLLFLSIAFHLLAAQSFASRPHFNSREFAGTYIIGNPSYAACLHLDAKGNFRTFDAKGSGHISPNGRCNHKNGGSGTYVFSHGVLKFTLLKFTRWQHSFAVNEPKSTFTMLPVRWSGRLYLLDEDTLADFANAINLGLEPRRSLITENYYGQFYLRTGDETKEVSGAPSLPVKWSSLLLKNPVEAQVTKVEVGCSYLMLTIDKGSGAGLKPEMRLIRENAAEPSLSFDPLIVFVEKNSARLQARGEWKVGDKLTTRFTATQLQ
ncbi:MAG: hypothetical protein WCB68_24450 [Pyrinomonadaceae bacterium]